MDPELKNIAINNNPNNESPLRVFAFLYTTSNVVGEGIFQTFKYILKGTLDSGLLGKKIKFIIGYNPIYYQEIKDSIIASLGTDDLSRYIELIEINHAILKQFTLHSESSLQKGTRKRILSFVKYITKFLGFANIKYKIKQWIKHKVKVHLTQKISEISLKASADCMWVVFPSPLLEYNLKYIKIPYIVNFYDFVFLNAFLYSPKYKQDVVSSYNSLINYLSHAKTVITQSQHNIDNNLIPIFSLPPQKIKLIYNCAPTIYTNIFPFYKLGDLRTSLSKKMAGDIINAYFLSLKTPELEVGDITNNFNILRLSSFNFKNQKYIFLSTQDRPYKNIITIIKLLSRLVYQDGYDINLILTAHISNLIGQKITDMGLADRVISIRRIPDKILAALYHCATLTIHPSHYEGGVGVYPFLEGMQLGCPTLICNGPHMREAVNNFPEYNKIIYNRDDIKSLTKRVKEIIENSDKEFEKQYHILKAHMQWTWEKSSEEYYNTFLEASKDKRL